MLRVSILMIIVAVTQSFTTAFGQGHGTIVAPAKNAVLIGGQDVNFEDDGAVNAYVANGTEWYVAPGDCELEVFNSDLEKVIDIDGIDDVDQTPNNPNTLNAYQPFDCP